MRNELRILQVRALCQTPIWTLIYPLVPSRKIRSSAVPVATLLKRTRFEQNRQSCCRRLHSLPPEFFNSQKAAPGTTVARAVAPAVAVAMAPATTPASLRPSLARLTLAQAPTPAPKPSNAAASTDAEPVLALQQPQEISSFEINQQNTLRAVMPLYDSGWMRRRLPDYIELAKPRLSVLIVLTAMASYAVAPSTANNVSALAFLTIGTLLCSASANSYNQFHEPIYDAQMNRTRNRPIVRGAIISYEAFSFATVCGVTGVATLWLGLNSTVALLGLSNIILYAFIYTPLKRQSILNTWVGAVVGALPPLMGWAACTGGDLLSHPGGLLMATILFAWQFPHFNSLAWNLRKEYARAGYRMMAVTDPDLNARVSFRYALLMFLPCIGLAASNIVDPFFVIDSSVVNLYVAAVAFKFWRDHSDKTAKNLFFACIIQLPVLLVLIMIHHVSLFWMRKESSDLEIDATNSVTTEAAAEEVIPSTSTNSVAH